MRGTVLRIAVAFAAPLLLEGVAAPLLLGGVATAQSPSVDVSASLSRTAVWVGDRTVYTVELHCAPQVDVLLDDLAGGRVRVEGGDIVAVEEDHQERPHGWLRRFRYTIVTYRIDTPEIRISAIPVRYFLRRAGGVQGAPAGQITVPAAVVPIRSVIPDVDSVPPLRVPATLRPAPRYLELAQSVGLAVMALAIVPFVLWSIDLTGRARRAWTRYRTRQARRSPRESLEDLRAASVTSDADRIHAFDRLNSLVREHLSLTTGITAEALTPPEIRAALEKRELPYTDVVPLLTTCEQARYAPDPPAQETWHDALRDAEQIMSASRR